MKFDLDSPRDAERFADTVANLQNADARFVVIHNPSDREVEIRFGKEDV